MIISGIVLLLIGFVFGIPLLWWIGAALLIAGATLWALGGIGHPVAGRRHYW